MNNENIVHTGVVIRKDNRECTVKISTPSDCGGCAASSLCNRTDDEITVDNSCIVGIVESGDKVNVEISSRMTWNAILYSSVIPLIILVVCVVAVDLLLNSEIAACITAVACVILYYSVCRKMNIFTVRKTKHNFKIYRYIS